MVRVNVIQITSEETQETKRDIQVLVPAQAYCVTKMPGDMKKAPEIWCVVDNDYLFLAEGRTNPSPKVEIENINIGGAVSVTLAVFNFPPFSISKEEIKTKWPHGDPLKNFLLGIKEESFVTSLHFDFSFYPPLRDRPEFLKACKKVSQVKFCLFKPVRYWTDAPFYLHEEVVNQSILYHPDRLATEVENNLFIVD